MKFDLSSRLQCSSCIIANTCTAANIPHPTDLQYSMRNKFPLQTLIMGVHMLKKDAAVFQTREEAEEADHARYRE